MKWTSRLKRGERGMSEGGDGNGGFVSNNDMTMNRMWRERVKDIGVLGEVDDGATIEDPLHGE
jgi:hypothetical protein